MLNDILLIDDEALTAQVMANILSAIGTTRIATSAREGISQVRCKVPDLILLDASMPDVDGFDLARMLKAETAFRKVPLIFVTAHDEPAFEVRALEIGACDFIRKPVNPAVLRARVETQLEVRRLTRELETLALADGLTGLANRRRFDNVLQNEWSRAVRGREAISLLMIDIDHFKAYNDHFGHPAGDACLVDVASAIAGSVRRAGDLVARLGGEEFAVLLPATPPEGARTVADSIMRAIADLAIPQAPASYSSGVSVSIGVATRSWDETDGAASADRGIQRALAASGTEDLVASADAALYEAKHGGRGRVRMARSGPSAPASETADATSGNAADPRRHPARETMRESALVADDASVWPQLPGFDSDGARERLSGDAATFRDLLRRLIHQFGKLGVEIPREDMDALAAQLHKFKGSAGTLGAVELQALAARAEIAARSGNRSLARKLAAQVRRQLALLGSEPALVMAG